MNKIMMRWDGGGLVSRCENIAAALVYGCLPMWTQVPFVFAPKNKTKHGYTQTYNHVNM